ncbi:MAG: hypothetical protein H7323_14955, partial [Frankiales bacterium]|nr:hypothetical protein [Frankiales bacterium]
MTPPATTRLPWLTRAAAWFPRGAELRDEDFADRHRVVRLVLAAHVPVLFGLTLLAG